MYFQFLIEDKSTEKLVDHVMKKLKILYPDREIEYNSKPFKGIGRLHPKGTILEQKTGQLLNDLPQYLCGFDKVLRNMENAAIIIIMDNDNRETEKFKQELNSISQKYIIITDHVFCIAVKEMEAWLLGDEAAIAAAYPEYKKKAMSTYEQDGICDTWEVLANAVYPGGLTKLKKKANGTYAVIGLAKSEWADRVGKYMDIRNNLSPSFNLFIGEMMQRIENC